MKFFFSYSLKENINSFLSITTNYVKVRGRMYTEKNRIIQKIRNLFKFKNKIDSLKTRGNQQKKILHCTILFNVYPATDALSYYFKVQHKIHRFRLLPHSLSRLWIHLRTIMSTIFYTTYNNKYTLFVRNGEINHWKRLLSSLLYPH